MKLITIDESGDLAFNFNKKSSKFFIFSFIFCEEANAEILRETMITVRDNLIKKGLWPRDLQELKFSFNYKRLQKIGIKPKILSAMRNKQEEIRLTVLRELSNISKYLSLYLSIVNKPQVSNKMRGDKKLLYNFYMIEPLLNDFIRPGERFKILLDKNMNKEAELRLGSYLNQKKEFYYANLHTDQLIELQQVNSKSEPLIWIADHVSGATFSKFEYNNPVFYNEIEHLIEKNSIRKFFR